MTKIKTSKIFRNLAENRVKYGLTVLAVQIISLCLIRIVLYWSIVGSLDGEFRDGFTFGFVASSLIAIASEVAVVSAVCLYVSLVGFICTGRSHYRDAVGFIGLGYAPVAVCSLVTLIAIMFGAGNDAATAVALAPEATRASVAAMAMTNGLFKNFAIATNICSLVLLATLPLVLRYRYALSTTRSLAFGVVLRLVLLIPRLINMRING